ncbi:hypothetical protein RNJ44_01476 [Nakaseomyces bracarensis]|uniref:tRNA (adenine(58)-N(1))-methyltransferase non-catalytic subunit TRM6 n=1 Tax=Nakaseomyces bracarensis TaxID=273131 RepID=A0ABR4NPW9_9SACH
MDPLKHIVAGQHVMLTLPSGNHKIVELKDGLSISLGKFGAFQVNDILGYPLGTTFEIYYDNVDEVIADKQKKPKRNELNKVPVGKVRLYNESKPEQTDVGEEESDSEESMTLPAELQNVLSSSSNKGLINIGNDIQKLTMKDIEQLKEQSATADEIITKMIESHGSFHKKTIHSQEKYLKRKKQKFAKYFTVDYLSSTMLLNFLLEKGDMQRVMDISEESIGLLLNLGNIRSDGTYLCMDETGGLLVYVLMERMFGGDNASEAPGKIIVVHENEHPNLDLLKFSNYSEKFIENHVICLSILDYFRPPTVQEIESRFTPLPQEEVKQMKSGKRNTYSRKLKWYYNQLRTVELASKQEYDGLVVASTLHLPTLVPRLAERVHGSRPIICFSQFKETLLELSHTLYSDLRYLAPTILETRCRPYQSIRGKLHPLMTMRGGGGYILWCHRVIPAPEPEIDEEEVNDQENKKQKIDASE